MAAAALVAAYVYDYFGSKVGLLVTNGMWFVGIAGVLVSLVALAILWFKRRRQSVRWSL